MCCLQLADDAEFFRACVCVCAFVDFFRIITKFQADCSVWGGEYSWPWNAVRR